MVAERWLLVASLLALWSGSKATNLTVSGMDLKATYLRIQSNEPNYEDETYYRVLDFRAISLTTQQEKEMEHKQTTWCNQCMWYEETKGSYDTNFENDIYEGHGRRKDNSSLEGEDTMSLDYRSDSRMNVKDNRVEEDEGMRKRKGVETDGMSLAVMNELYTNISYGWYFVVNFVYINFYENLTAELYAMMMMMSALWIWRMRSTRRKKVRRSHLGCYEKKVVLWVPVARLEKKRQRLQELCLQRKVKVVLWLSMMGSAQAMQEGMQGGSPVASGSQGERVFLERVTSLTEAATAAANAAAQHFRRCSRGHLLDWKVQQGFSNHQTCLQVRIQWCFKHGSSNSRRGCLLVTRGFKKFWRRLKHHEMIQQIHRVLQLRRRSLARNSTRCWLPT